MTKAWTGAALMAATLSVTIATACRSTSSPTALGKADNLTRCREHHVMVVTPSMIDRRATRACLVDGGSLILDMRPGVWNAAVGVSDSVARADTSGVAAVKRLEQSANHARYRVTATSPGKVLISWSASATASGASTAQFVKLRVVPRR